MLPLVYEMLIYDPQTVVGRLCEWCAVPLSDAMLSFKQPLVSTTPFATNAARIANSEKKHPNPITAMDSSPSTGMDMPYCSLLSNAEKNHIEEDLGRSYLHCWNDDILRLRAALAEKTWFGFDLDGTLHEFRLSSGKATNNVLEDISERYGTLILASKDKYGRVLKERRRMLFRMGKCHLITDRRDLRRF